MPAMFPAVEPAVPGAEPVVLDRAAALRLHAELRRSAASLRHGAGWRRRSASAWLGDWEGRFRAEFDGALADLCTRLEASAGACDEALKVLVAVWDYANEEQWYRNRNAYFAAVAAAQPPLPAGFPT